MAAKGAAGQLLADGMHHRVLFPGRPFVSVMALLVVVMGPFLLRILGWGQRVPSSSTCSRICLDVLRLGAGRRLRPDEGENQ